MPAVIWDMDGVIADTGVYHCRAWQKVFRRRGVSFTEEDFRRHFGQRNDTIIRATLGQSLPQSEVDALATEKEQLYRRFARSRIRPLPGAIPLLRTLAGHGFKMALGSSAPPENIRLVLEELGIESYLTTMVYGREVAEGKPSPQVFLLAAQKLGVEPKDCIVIEDSIAGVAAAKRAGMKCIAVTTTHPRESLAQADLVVGSLEEVSVEDLKKLLKGEER